MRPTIAILSLACLALAAALLVRSKARMTPAEMQHLETQIAAFSNQVEEARARVDDQEKLSAFLQSNLTARATDLAAASHQLSSATNALSQVEGQLRVAQAEARALAARATQAEGERDGLQARLNQLAQDINSLNDQIAETRRKLASAEGDRDSLSRELARLQNDKAELVRQFNDVAAVRAQLALLREEASVNQRLAWMSQGVYQRAGQKGAQALVARPAPDLAVNRPGLDVELHQTNSRPANP